MWMMWDVWLWPTKHDWGGGWDADADARLESLLRVRYVLAVHPLDHPSHVRKKIRIVYLYETLQMLLGTADVTCPVLSSVRPQEIAPHYYVLDNKLIFGV